MPLYDILCKNCGELTDIWAKIAEMHVLCPQCGATTVRLISPTRIICDLEPYWDSNLADTKKAPHGTYVTSRQQRKEEMKRLGLAEIG